MSACFFEPWPQSWRWIIKPVDCDKLDGLFLQADKLMQTGDFTSSIKLLIKCIKKCPLNSLASYNLGLVFYKAGKYLESIYALEEAVNKGADDPEVFNQLGLASEKNGDRNGAAAYYRKALDLDPGFAMSWNNLGVIFFLEEEYSAAKIHFEKALEFDNSDPDTWYNLRDTYTELGLDQEAEIADSKYHELLRH